MPSPSDRFDTRLEVQPPLTDDSLQTIPAKRGVVLLASPADEPIVLLTAADMRARVRNRLSEPPDESTPTRRADLREITGAIHYRLCGSHFETDWQYLQIAAALWPKRFRQMVSWKPPWLVSLDIDDPAPHFGRTRLSDTSAGRCWGPFSRARDADDFVEALQDAFDLCRSVTCLRRAPDGPRCTYAEMGRCLSPADGSISMDDYRQALRRAAAFVDGDRQPRREELADAMHQAAGELAFEKAAACKQRLQRLAIFDGERFERVAPMEQFRFISFQPSGSRKTLTVLFADGGHIDYAPALKMPLAPNALEQLLAGAEAFFVGDHPPAVTDHLSEGLIARALYAGPERGGSWVRWNESLTPEALLQRLQCDHDALGVRPPITPAKADSPPATEKTASDSTPPAAYNNDSSSGADETTAPDNS
jgi:excinuclease UvrABC nuclease subunit